MNLEFNCPSCSRPLDDTRQVTVGYPGPAPGDINLCGECGCVAVFDPAHALGIRPITMPEARALSEDERSDLWFALRAIMSRGRLNESAQALFKELNGL